jgi:hypothetical protein
MGHRFGFDGCLLGKTALLCSPCQQIGDGPASATVCGGVSTRVWTYNLLQYNGGQDIPLRPRRHFIPAKAQRTVVRRPLHSTAEDDRGNGTVVLLREPCKHHFGPAMIPFQTSPCLSGLERARPYPRKLNRASRHVEINSIGDWRAWAGGSHGRCVGYQATPAWRGSAKNHSTS